MADPIVYEWRVYCLTQEAWVYGIGAEAPTTCYASSSHQIDPLATTLVERISPTVVTIAEQTSVNTVPGYYGSYCFNMNVNPGVGVVSTDLFSFPFPIAMLNVQIQVAQNNVGDIMDCQIAPNTTIGVLTAPLASGSNIFIASASVIANAFLGLQVNIIDGLGENINLGRITNINVDNYTVTTEFNSSANINTGSFVQVTRYMVKDCYLATPGAIKLGYGKVGGAYFPANTQGTMVYTNTTGGAKNISLIMEYLY